jgi:hypothetical protein
MCRSDVKARYMQRRSLIRELHPVRAPHLLSKFWVCPEGKAKIWMADSGLTREKPGSGGTWLWDARIK